MPLTQVGLSAGINWTLARPVAGFADVVQGGDTAAFDLGGLNLAVWNELFGARYTLGPGATQAVDLRAFTDPAGTAVATADKVLALLILVAGAAADKLNVKPHGTNGLQWFFGGTAEGINIPGGGMNLFSEGPTGSGTAVDATHKQLLLTNTGGADLTVKLVALVSDI